MARRDSSLGNLERATMNIFWDSDAPLTVRDVAAHFPDHAYTTILTVCDRLLRKGMLTRELEGRSHRYRPVANRDSYVSALIDEALSSIDDRESLLMGFVARMSDTDADALRRALRRRPK